MSDAKAGQKISECDVEFRRPGYGIPPDQFEMIKNAQLKIDISSGDILTMQHIEWN